MASKKGQDHFLGKRSPLGEIDDKRKEHVPLLHQPREQRSAGGPHYNQSEDQKDEKQRVKTAEQSPLARLEKEQ